MAPVLGIRQGAHTSGWVPWGHLGIPLTTPSNHEHAFVSACGFFLRLGAEVLSQEKLTSQQRESMKVKTKEYIF